GRSRHAERPGAARGHATRRPHPHRARGRPYRSPARAGRHGVSYVITELCTLDGSCVEVCPVACIHTQPDAPQYYIDPDVCIECEQCEIVCPVNAIAVDWKLPDQYLPWIEINASFFRKNKAAAASVSMETAFQMVRAAQDHATEINAAIAVAVVDLTGAPIVVAAMDGAEPGLSE